MLDLIATMASLTVAIVNLIVALLSYATCFLRFLKLFYGKGLKIGGAFSIGTVEGFYSTRGNEF